METSLARDLMSDEEWAFHERFILAVRAPNGRKPTNHRLVLDGIFWIARTGSPWRDLPEEFGKWSGVRRCLVRPYRQQPAMLYQRLSVPVRRTLHFTKPLFTKSASSCQHHLGEGKGHPRR